MINIKPTLRRSTSICTLRPAFFKSPESLLGSGEFGESGVASWQIGKSQAEVFAHSSE